jgi:GNAT superfamily N-acetyltransferase
MPDRIIMVPGYSVRLSRRADVGVLPSIERASMQRFVDYETELGFRADVPPAPNSPDTLLAAHADGRLWVAIDPTEQPVGFALVLELGLFAHLEELVVLPARGGQGLGGALLEAVCGWADSRGFSAVTVAAYRDVPWNAPFCARRRFEAIAAEDLPPELVQVLDRERALGLRTDRRVVMQREL